MFRLFIIISLIVGVFIETTAQNPLQNSVSITVENQKLKSVFEEIESQQNVKFNYYNRFVKKIKYVTISANNWPLEKVLETILAPHNLTFSYMGGKIINIKPKNRLVGSSLNTVNGFVRDEASLENIAYCKLYFLQEQRYIETNAAGYFSFSTSSPIIRLYVREFGYKDSIISLDLNHNEYLPIYLSPSNILPEVEITAEKLSEIAQDVDMAIINPSILEDIPYAYGQKDILQHIQYTANVKPAGTLQSGITVRGGSPDQNLFLLNNIPLYNATHILGLLSVFDANTLQNARFIKGYQAPAYKGRLSSVLDVQLKQGNKKEFHGRAQAGLLWSSLMLEGPLVKNKLSFLVSARRTYPDLFFNLYQAISNSENRQSLYFYDITSSVHYRINDRNGLTAGFYHGKDEASLKLIRKFNDSNSYRRTNETQINYGNTLAFVQWKNALGNRFFLQFDAGWTQNLTSFNDQQRLQNQTERTDIINNSYRYNSKVSDGIVKLRFDYYPSKKQEIQFGLNIRQHLFLPGQNLLQSNTSDFLLDTSYGLGQINATESDLYFEDKIQLGKWVINLGLNFANYLAEDINHNFLMPRLKIAYELNNDLSISASYQRNIQYVLLVPNNDYGLPTDIWLPISKGIEPMNGDGFNVGFWGNINKNSTFNFTTYYNYLNNVAEYRNGALASNSLSWDDWLLACQGRNYGLEINVNVNIASFKTRFAYNFSRSIRSNEDINSGEWFSSKFDRPHQFNVLGIYNFNKHWKFLASWIFLSGNPVTIPTQKYSVSLPSSLGLSNIQNYQFSDRNNYRMPHFHRLDFGLEYQYKGRKKGQNYWKFGINNAYNRQNPLYLFIDYDPTVQTYQVFQKSVSFIYPYINYEFVF